MAVFQNRLCATPWRKQGWIPRRTISWWKASLPPQKEIWAFFRTFSFHFLSFNGVFLSLKCRTLALKHLHGVIARQPFVENGYLSLRFPNMVKVNIHEHWTRVSRFNPLWVSDNSQSHSANVFRVDDSRSEPRVLHELTQKKMAEDAESDIAIRFVDEND